MKVPEGNSHKLRMRVVAPPADTSSLERPAEVARALPFEVVYDRYFEEVERWLRTMGVPSAELEDLAQEVFLVVRRKMDAFDGRNLGGWLFRITSRTASDHRRRGWFKHLFSRRSEVSLQRLEWSGQNPADAYEEREARAELEKILAKMGEKRRVAFVMFEVEGYSGEEIAELLEVPLGTVWTRLHHARKEFFALVQERLRKEMK